MTRTVRPPQPMTCPNCGRVAEGAPHYCPGCGLDYWRVAAGATPTPLASRRPPPPAPPARGRSAALVAVGLAGLLAAGVGTAVMVVGGLEPDAPLVAQTRPSRGPEDFLIERFFREARDPHARFSYTNEGTLRQMAPERFDYAVSETILVYGNDYLVRGTYTTDGEAVEETLAVVDGIAYLQLTPEGEWLTGETHGDDRPGSPFFRITTVGEIEYVEEQQFADGTVHHRLAVTKWLGGSGTDFRVIGAGRLVHRTNRLDVWVTEDGIPVRAEITSSFSLQGGGVSNDFVTELEMTFDDWGDVDPIAPPNAPVPEPAAARERPPRG